MGRLSSARVAVFVLVAATLAAAASCVSPSTSNPATPPAASPERLEPGDLTDRVVQAHNLRRAKAGLPSLAPNPMLGASADEHARDMSDRRKMSHRGGDGSSSFDRISRHGYQFRTAGENVAYGFDDVESVMSGWMRSPGHRRNILGPYTEIGVGRAIAKDGASYWCVTFGTSIRR